MFAACFGCDLVRLLVRFNTVTVESTVSILLSTNICFRFESHNLGFLELPFHKFLVQCPPAGVHCRRAFSLFAFVYFSLFTIHL